MAAERLRRQLLKDSGITCWFPRGALAGAAPSHRVCIELSEVDAPALSPSPVQPPSVAPVPLRSVVELMNKVNVPAPLVEPALQVNLSQPEKVRLPVVEDSAGPFGFSWFAIDNRLSVLAMLPPAGSRLSGSCRLMLERMLGALHTPWQSLALEEQSFHWPFADMPELADDASAARQAAEGFIARRLRVRQSAMLLVLSDELPWFLKHAGLDFADAGTGKLHVHRQFECAMLSTHSLHAMEQDAGLKREAWQSMQVLRERLGRS